MRLFECQKCGAKVELPDEMPPQFMSEVRKVVGGSRLDALMYIRDNSRLDLKQSKAVTNHLSGANGACHRCGTVLPDGEEVHCQKCRSFNLKW